MPQSHYQAWNHLAHREGDMPWCNAWGKMIVHAQENAKVHSTLTSDPAWCIFHRAALDECSIKLLRKFIIATVERYEVLVIGKVITKSKVKQSKAEVISSQRKARARLLRDKLEAISTELASLE